MSLRLEYLGERVAKEAQDSGLTTGVSESTPGALVPAFPLQLRISEALIRRSSGTSFVGVRDHGDGGSQPILTQAALTDLEEAAAPESPEGGAPESPDGSGAKKRKTRWAIPPIRVWGNVSNNTRVSTSETSPHSTGNTTTLRIDAGSYIWQPWFAQVTGGVGFNYNNEWWGSSPRNHSTSNSISGSGGLALLTDTRFPFDAFVDVSNSRTGAQTGLLGDTTQTHFGMRQAYTPLVGVTRYNGSYDRSILKGPFGRDVLDSVSGSVVTTIKDYHGLNLQGTVSRNEIGGTSDRAIISALTGTHSYREYSNFSVDNLLNLGRNEIKSNASNSTGAYQQLSSFATWSPKDVSKPLYLTGSARVSHAEIETGGFSTQSSNFYASLGVGYEYSAYTHLGGSVGLGLEPGGRRTTTESVNISYSPSLIKLGKFDYNWNTGASVSTSTGSEDKSIQRGASAGHSLGRNYKLSDTSSLGARVSQNASINDGRALFKSLSHSASLSWNQAMQDGNASVTGSISDSRSFADTNIGMQMFNVQATLGGQISRYSSLTGDMTIQGSRQIAVGSPADFDILEGGSISYSHSQFLNVPRLRFSSSFRMNTSQLATRFTTGQVGAPRENVRSSLDNRLDYSIGKMDLNLVTQHQKVEGAVTGLIYFNVVRRFGDN
jgi:hypothetical protein